MRDLTENELLEELARVAQAREPEQGGGLTSKEIAKALGWTQHYTNRELDRLLEAGLWEHVKLPRLQRNGDTRRRDCYRPKRVA